LYKNHAKAYKSGTYSFGTEEDIVKNCSIGNGVGFDQNKEKRGIGL